MYVHECVCVHFWAVVCCSSVGHLLRKNLHSSDWLVYLEAKTNLVHGLKVSSNYPITDLPLMVSSHAETVSPILVELLSTKEIVPMETVQGLFCGFSRVTGTVSLERDVPVEFFKCNVSML